MLGVLNPAAPPPTPTSPTSRTPAPTRNPCRRHADRRRGWSPSTPSEGPSRAAARRQSGRGAGPRRAGHATDRAAASVAVPAAATRALSRSARLLLTLSGDAQANPAAGQEARELAAAVGREPERPISTRRRRRSACSPCCVGSVIDRAFAPPRHRAGRRLAAAGAAEPRRRSRSSTLAGPAGHRRHARIADRSAERDQGRPRSRAEQQQTLDGNRLQRRADAQRWRRACSCRSFRRAVSVSGDLDFGISISKSSPNGALVIGSDALGAKLAIGELGVGLRLKNGAPTLTFLRAQGQGDDQAERRVPQAHSRRRHRARLRGRGGSRHRRRAAPHQRHGTQGEPAGADVADRAVQAAADQPRPRAGRQQLPASAGRAVGIVRCRISDRSRRRSIAWAFCSISTSPTPAVRSRFAFKPPNGIGLVLDAGIVKGGGYLAVDENGYAGVLELKMLAVRRQSDRDPQHAFRGGLFAAAADLRPVPSDPAVVRLHAHRRRRPDRRAAHRESDRAVARHCATARSTRCCSRRIRSANAPRIINTLRTLFPVKRGGFVIGPMLELGWGTPSLVTVRLGLLDRSRASSRCSGRPSCSCRRWSRPISRCSICASISSARSSSIRCASRSTRSSSIRASRSFRSPGQFAFRAQFGDQPTFLISAGGFHPRFKEIPSDIPVPFDRVGASFDIGIVGVSFKGYFAITSATVQAGSELRVWADIGIAGHRRRIRLRRDLLSRAEVLFRTRSARVSGRARLRHRFRVDPSRRVARRPGSLAHRRARQAFIRRGRCRTSRCMSTRRGGPTAIRRRSRSTSPISSRRKSPRPRTGPPNCRRGGESLSLALADIKAGDRPPRASARQPRLPAEARTVRVADGQGERQRDRRRQRVLRRARAAVAGRRMAPPQNKPASTRSDFFAAAQFLEMSQADRLTKPSFETIHSRLRS